MSAPLVPPAFAPSLRSARCAALARAALAALAALVAAGGARADASPVIVVLPVGNDPALTTEVRAALAAVGTVQDAAATHESVAAARALGITCDAATPACMVQLGALMSGDLVVGGSVGPAPGAEPGSTTVTLRLVRVASGKEVRSERAVVPAAGPARDRALRRLAVRTVDPTQDRGTITIRVMPSDASVFIDGTEVPPKMRAAPVTLPTGRHEIYAAHPLFESVSEVFHIHIGENVSWDRELVREPGAPGLPLQPGGQPGADRAHGAPPPTSWRVAIAVVDATGFDERVRRAVADALADEIEKHDGVDVVRLDDIRRRLPDETALMVACREPGCSALVAGELGAESLVYVDLALADGRSAITARRVDGRTGALLMEDVRQGLTHQGGRELAEVIGPIVQRLFADRRLRRGEVRGVDELPFGGSARAHPRSRAGLPPWLFWSSLGATGVAAVTGAGLTALAFGDNEGLREGALFGMWVAWGATAALTATDVALALNTDWGE